MKSQKRPRAAMMFFPVGFPFVRWALALAWGLLMAGGGWAFAAPMNVLLFTADDLGADRVGIEHLGGGVPGLTPHLDAFTRRGRVFRQAHVVSAICVPSRGAIATGRYGFASGVYGFQRATPGVPVIMEIMRTRGYRTGILSKVAHSTPHAAYRWDFVRDFAELGSGRSPSRYAAACRAFFAECRAAGRPFYFMVNSDDPHRPYHNPEKPVEGAEAPSRLYAPEDVAVPEYLPDLPGVRRELAWYCNSVRRLDDTFGAVMRELEAAGLAATTVVVFLSDNGIAMPFAKANCYLASTRTPLTIHWPGLTEPGEDREHFVPEIDLLPTLLEGLGLPAQSGVQGRSFLPLLRGGRQTGRERVFTHIDYKVSGPPTPMRALQDRRYGYLFSPWSDGTTVYRNNNEGQAFRAMEAAAKEDPAIAARVRMFRLRTVEEFYDLESDPGCLRNLAGDPAHAAALAEFRRGMETEMRRHGDPLLAAFLARDDPARMRSEVERCYRERLPRGAEPVTDAK